MVSSMGGNAVGDVVDGNVVDGNVTSKARDVGDNGGMTCGAKVSRGGVEYIGDMKVWEGGVEYSYSMEVSGGGMEVSSMEPLGRPPPRSPTRPGQPPPCLPLLPLPRPWIGCILIAVGEAGGLMDGPCDVDASSSCAAMLLSSPIRCKTDLAI